MQLKIFPHPLKIIAIIIAALFTQWRSVKRNHCVKARQFVNLVFHQRVRSLAPRTSAVSPPRFVRFTTPRSRTMPVSLPIVQLLLFFIYLFSLVKESASFRENTWNSRVRRGRKLSDCRHLSVGLSLINDGNIPPYTVTRPAAGTRPTPFVVYKRYCRLYRAAFLPAFTVSTTAAEQETYHYCRVNADLRFSMKSFFLRRIYRNYDRYFESICIDFTHCKSLTEYRNLIIMSSSSMILW